MGVEDVTTAENPDILLATAAMSHPAVDVVVAAVVVDLEAVPITAPATSVSRRVISLGIAPMSRRGVYEAALQVSSNWAFDVKKNGFGLLKDTSSVFYVAHKMKVKFCAMNTLSRLSFSHSFLLPSHFI